MKSPWLSARAQPPEQEGIQLPGPGERKPVVVGVTAADVILPPLSLHIPALQSFEELGIPASFRAAVEKELTADEKMLWLGRPSRNPLVHPRNTPILMIGLGLIGLGLTTIVVSLGLGMGFFPIVFGSVLALLGLIFQIPRVVDPTKNCRSCYVVTNRRALLVEVNLWSMGPRAQSYLPHQLLGLERRAHPEVAGAGDLIFEYVVALGGHSFNQQSGFTLQQGTSFGRSDGPKRIPRGFILLDQLREVENLIRTTLLQQLEKALDEPRLSPAVSVALEPSDQVVSSVCACGLTVEAPSNLAGKAVRCPQCSAAVTLPAVEIDPAYIQPCREDGLISADLKAKVLADLDPNEKVVWLGQPISKLILARNSGYFFGAGVGAVVALVWLTNALLPAKTSVTAAQQKITAPQQPGKAGTAAKKEATPNLLPPLGFLCVSVGFALVPFVRWHFAKGTCYALTNRRALVYQPGLFGPTRDSYPPLEVAAMRRSNSWLFGGRGDLIFRTVMTITHSRSSKGTSSSSVRTTHFGFLAIAHLDEVEKLVRETLINPFVDKLNRASYLQ